MSFTTVGDLVDGTFRQWLEPPDYQPPMGTLRQPVDGTDGVLKLDEYTLPEDEQLLRVGVLLEADHELMRVVGYDSADLNITVRRGELGTTSSPHVQFSPVKISPPYPRVDVFEAVRNNVVGLSPRLFTTNVMQVFESVAGVAVLDDELAISIIDLTRESTDQIPTSSFDLVDHHPATGTRSVLMPQGMGDVWVRYRRRMGFAQSEDAVLTELGLDPMWVPAVLAGAAADMMVGRDLSRTTTEWVGQVLETQGVKVGSRQELAFGLVQYRELLVSRYASELQGDQKSVTVRMRSPWQHVTGGVV